MKKLALNGGEKTIFKESPHYIWPEITKKTEEMVIKQLYKSISIYDRSGIIKDMEDAFAVYHGSKYALLTNSGTSAIYSMFVGLNLKRGDEVICPAYTFFATVTPLFFTGAIPILVDCDENGNIDPEEIEKKITSKTRAIVITHMWGIPCNMDRIIEISKKYNISLLEDGSHAHGAVYKGKKVGSFGDASAFSLQGQKTVTGGEGGILLTNNDDIYQRALLLGHYNKRCKQEIPKDSIYYKYFVTGMGLKLRSHPLAVAIAYEQFENLDNVLTQRRRFAQYIMDELKDFPVIKIPKIGKDVLPSWYALVLQFNSDELGGVSREVFCKALVAEGCLEVDIPNSTAPLNLLQLFNTPTELFDNYSSMTCYKEGDFESAERFYKKAIKIPIWHNVNNEDIVYQYVTAIKKVINNYQELL